MTRATYRLLAALEAWYVDLCDRWADRIFDGIGGEDD